MNSHLKISFKYDFLNIYFLYFITVIVVYFLPFTVSKIYLLGLLIPLIYSKKNYFWIAFFFLLIESPGFLFDTFDANHKLELYGFGVTSDRSIYYQEIIYIILFIKALIIHRNYISNFTKIYKVFLIFVLFLFIVGLLYGISTYRLFHTLRCFIPFTLFYSIAILFKSFDDYKEFFRLLFPFMFFIIAVQISEFFLGQPLAMYLGGEYYVEKASTFIDPFSVIARPLYSYNYVMIIFIGALFYLNTKKKYFNNTYLTIVIVCSVFSIFISATRGYLLSLIIMLLLSQLLNKSTRKSIIKIVLLVMFILPIAFSQPIIHEQITKAFERLTTLGALAKGDLTAGGTSIRMTIRKEGVMQHFNESPIIGFGFSDKFWDHADGHVGHYTMLLNSGILGYTLFWIILLLIILKIFHANKMISNQNQFKNTLYLFFIGLVGWLVIHSTSNMIFSYVVLQNASGFPIAFAIFFCFMDNVIFESKKLHKDILNEKRTISINNNSFI